MFLVRFLDYSMKLQKIMINLIKLGLILNTVLVFIPGQIKSQEIDCEKSLKIQEKQVLDIITLYGKNTNIENLVIGSYNYNRKMGDCNHHILVKYERKNDELSTEYYIIWDTIFRYFNRNEFGNDFIPPVFMHGRKPIIEDPEGSIRDEKLLYPSYECEQRFEFEEESIRKYQGTYSPSTWAASMVIPKKHYPFCEYHIFLMYPEILDDPSSEIWFTHVLKDETGGWHLGGYPSRSEFVVKGRKIPKSQVSLPP